MTFKLVDSYDEIRLGDDGYYLIHSNWDDWFKYETTYSFYIKKNVSIINVGSLKIGEMVMLGRVPRLPSEFENLPDNFFSLVTDESFYYEIDRIAKEQREYILTSLRDVAFNKALYEKVKGTDVFQVSLTRGILSSTIENKYFRLAEGDTKLSDYDFSFRMTESCSLNFRVNPQKFPASNIHAIIGRNGVGKSYLLTEMVDSAINKDERFSFNTEYQDNFFSNIISVNFSNFENKKLFEESEDRSNGYLYYHLSNKTEAKKPEKCNFLREQDGEIINYVPEGWNAVFIESLRLTLRKKPKLWRDCINILYSDPIFSQTNVHLLSDTFQTYSDLRKFNMESYKIFNSLSSGHKIVLLTITKLVELAFEKTLVILDEPELHLHPPLLSSFIRSLSHLLIKRNGVAILATHSPVILQEVQKDCVYKLTRDVKSDAMDAHRPDIETFAQDIGSLTFEVFNLEAKESGFNTLINQIAREGLDFEESLSRFDNKMGSLGYKLLLSKILERELGDGPDA
ncbi:ATP-binding protein [Streptococcus sp. CF9-1]|jgi:putative phage resistance endonuclease|uniref:AAA family ATPase n=1 Tax=unclassified Streptococcus TaxID=2608887 RepID=UPI0020C8D4AD|nr:MULTISPECIES: AAA family ATPase [unclassified Streptococcus]MCP8994179.1 ATP-binding protein [Streptococcus sp. CF9-3]MCP8997938.1 ATP-binding protein [Streptococcus sp. CF9-1]